MSRTSKTNSAKVPSPVRYYVSFSGATGTFSYWDRDAKERVDLGESLDIVMMDTRSAVTGWSDDLGGRIYSNRVVSTTKEVLNVRCGRTEVATGMWADIKESVKSRGGKFCTEVFALANISGNWQPVQIELAGGSLGDWMTMLETVGGKYGLYNSVVTMERGEQKKKGAVKFYGMAFKTSELTKDLSEQANVFNDDMLQPYLIGEVESQATSV